MKEINFLFPPTTQAESTTCKYLCCDSCLIQQNLSHGVGVKPIFLSASFKSLFVILIFGLHMEHRTSDIDMSSTRYCWLMCGISGAG